MNEMDNTTEQPESEQSSETTSQGACNTCAFDKDACLKKLTWAATRAKDVVLQPQIVWGKIKVESSALQDTYRNYLLLMVAIPPVCGFLGGVIGGGPFFGLLGMQIVAYILGLATPLITAFIVEKIAPSCGGSVDYGSALKYVAYAATPMYVAGFLNLVPNIAFATLSMLVSLYSLYVYYQGIPHMTGVPEENRMKFAVISIAIMVVIFLILGLIVGGLFVGGALMSSGARF